MYGVPASRTRSSPRVSILLIRLRKLFTMVLVQPRCNPGESLHAIRKVAPGDLDLNGSRHYDSHPRPSASPSKP
jgi:hypothetical protein